ncbi:MAG: saccharopine dehydrogenase NADP-binding domain-containing protein [Desulfofustis sp.]|nr:saccharopine dehydrogenase NADP-binding domain-containing protein [Desulfofustis sp.]
MTKTINRIVVLGLGKVGHLVAELLQRTGFTVLGADQAPPPNLTFTTRAVNIDRPASLAAVLDEVDAVVSCLPYRCNAVVAEAAATAGRHYFDLTEDVATTRTIRALSDRHRVVMAPQCGLAPGFIAIVGNHLASSFHRIRSIKLRVGALPKHPTGLLGYAFNWSPEGVMNEYLNDCEVIEDGIRKWISPLEWLETIVIDGVQLEAFTTSGGLGSMCESFAGRVENLDYKSIRYPGHAKLMNFLLHELLLREDRERAGTILVNAKPPVNDDVVYIHASVEGWRDGTLLREEFVRAYDPLTIDGITRRTIAWTTAASVCAVVELVADGLLSAAGFIRQEEIPLSAFLATANGRLYDGRPHGGGRPSSPVEGKPPRHFA